MFLPSMGGGNYNLIRLFSKKFHNDFLINSDLNGILPTDQLTRFKTTWNTIALAPYSSGGEDYSILEDNSTTTHIQTCYNIVGFMVYYYSDKINYIWTNHVADNTVGYTSYRPMIEFKE